MYRTIQEITKNIYTMVLKFQYIHWVVNCNPVPFSLEMKAKIHLYTANPKILGIVWWKSTRNITPLSQTKWIMWPWKWCFKLNYELLSSHKAYIMLEWCVVYHSIIRFLTMDHNMLYIHDKCVFRLPYSTTDHIIYTVIWHKNGKLWPIVPLFSKLLNQYPSAINMGNDDGL